jgi:DNA-binding MarR family transcriptional regulator
MKFYININQEKLIELAPDARLPDGAVMDYVYWLCSSPSQEVENCRIVVSGEKYTWVNYDWLIQDMPLLKGKSRSTLTPVFKRLEKWGFIKTHQIASGRKYVHLVDKADLLFRNQNSPVRKTKQGRFANETNQSTSNPDIKSEAKIPKNFAGLKKLNDIKQKLLGNNPLSINRTN